jgi:hypothetical protein
VSRNRASAATRSRWPTKTWLARGEHFVERSLQHTCALEPVVPVAEPLHAVAIGEIRLRLPNFGHTEIAEAQVGREPRLVVAVEESAGAGDIRPLREARPPPVVVFRSRVELREIERNHPSLRPRAVGAARRHEGPFTPANRSRCNESGVAGMTRISEKPPRSFIAARTHSRSISPPSRPLYISSRV